MAAAFDLAAETLRPGSAPRLRLEAVATGQAHRTELADGAFAMEQAYVTKLRSESFFESHRTYIDLQLMVTGEELMEVEDISRLTVAEAYVPERDVVKYADVATASQVRLRPGDVALYFPSDGHMGSLRSGGQVLVRKVVVKIPVAGV